MSPSKVFLRLLLRLGVNGYYEPDTDGSLLIESQSGETLNVAQITAHESLFFADITRNFMY